MTLAGRIEQRIRAIPTSNPSYISVAPETLGRLLSDRLLRKIAEEAAAEAVNSSKPEQE